MGLKGSGNYGVFGIGAYNGQGGSFVEQNDNMHVVARLTLPITFANCQHMEIGAQAYTGKYTVLSSLISPLAWAIRQAGTLRRAIPLASSTNASAGPFVWYPQPLGFQAEWNVGRGPSLNDAQTAVIDRSLTGGYAMTMYHLEGPRGATCIRSCAGPTTRAGTSRKETRPTARSTNGNWAANGRSTHRWNLPPSIRLPIERTRMRSTRQTSNPTVSTTDKSCGSSSKSITERWPIGPNRDRKEKARQSCHLVIGGTGKRTSPILKRASSRVNRTRCRTLAQRRREIPSFFSTYSPCPFWEKTKSPLVYPRGASPSAQNNPTQNTLSPPPEAAGEGWDFGRSRS